ncbi:uncharacterized protein [Dermacentor albipictus]|uniref:uncharacterized protein isoform X13 n=1 Tax=Dermacentor albipictus TaxID=60249 RepID=UPI0038FC5427
MPDAGEGDPNMMPMEGMPPQDQNWMDYALELNPYRKTIEVFLMLSMLTTCLGVAGYCILSYLIVEYFFGSGGLLRAAETAMEVCTDNACGEYEHRTMGFVDWKGSPCENYFKYACSGFQKEAVDLNFAVYRPHNEVIDIEYDIISELLFQDGSDQWPSKIFELHKIAKEAYRICRATEGFHADLVRELYSAKSRGVSYVISKFEQLHPIWPFYTPVVGDMKCYLFPPEMFVPVTAYKNEDLMDEFAAAYMNHLKDSGLDETPEVRNDIDFFLNVEKTMAKLSTHPKRRLYKPIERTSVTNDIPKFLSADIVGCKDKPYVWADEDHYKGVKEVIDKMDNSSLTLYIIMWSIQTFSIAGKENTPLARLHYRYVELLNNPPPAERRCIDYLEPMLRQYYLDHLRVAHVYLRDDLPRTSQLQATQAMQRLVTALKGFLQNSALDELDVAKATSMLDGVKFELFYPGKLDDPGFSDAHYALAFAAPSSAAGGQRLDAFRALVGPFISRAPELNMGWPIPSFSYDPVYMPGIDTIYVPYPVFAWAYMHSRSKLLPKNPWSDTRPSQRSRPCTCSTRCTRRRFISTRRTPWTCDCRSSGRSTPPRSSSSPWLRMELLANHMPQYTEHFGCQPSQRMHVSRRYKRCLFWRR